MSPTVTTSDPPTWVSGLCVVAATVRRPTLDVLPQAVVMARAATAHAQTPIVRRFMMAVQSGGRCYRHPAPGSEGVRRVRPAVDECFGCRLGVCRPDGWCLGAGGTTQF